MAPTNRMRELAIRHAAFAWLDQQRAAGKETFTQEDTSGLQLAGETVRLMPTQQGIWKPSNLDAALSIRTVYRREGSARPYDDAVGEDGFYRYKMRGDDPNHHQNRSLRTAMVERLPLMWWLGVEDGGYSALYPIYLLKEEPLDLQFVVDIDAVRSRTSAGRLSTSRSIPPTGSSSRRRDCTSGRSGPRCCGPIERRVRSARSGTGICWMQRTSRKTERAGCRS